MLGTLERSGVDGGDRGDLGSISGVLGADDDAHGASVGGWRSRSHANWQAKLVARRRCARSHRQIGTVSAQLFPRTLGRVTEVDGLSRVRADAQARGIPIDVKERPHANSLEEAAAILGIRPADIAKSIVMRAGSDRYLFAIVPGDASVSFAKLRALLGVNKLKFPSADEAFEAVGHERGTITPLGSLHEYVTYVDASLVGQRVSMGAGAHGYSVWVDVDDLVRGLGAVVADIAG